MGIPHSSMGSALDYTVPMAPENSRTEDNPYRLLPSVEEVLASEPVKKLEAKSSRGLIQAFLQEILEAWRGEIKAGSLDADQLRGRLADAGVAKLLDERLRHDTGSGLRRAVNVAGVVLHTGLGRAPVHPEAAAAMAEAAGNYCVLEVDRWTGKRNKRDGRLSDLLVRLTGAEAGIAVNNNAAAVLMTLNEFAAGQGTVVSRGELVEIGGSFRVPDVMVRAGTRLCEVGTTNRTRIADYRRAVEEAPKEGIGLFYKVHESNFRVVGFTETVQPEELAELGRELGVVSAFDLGSGLIDPEGSVPLQPLLGDEPLVLPAVQSGVNVVSFSGDKLLGGPQAGLIVGKRAAIERLRKNPLYRALRLDKVSLAGLEKTLELLLAGRGDEIPARAMMIAAKEEMSQRAKDLVGQLSKLPGVSALAIEDATQPGSGSAPGVFLPTWVVRVKVDGLGAEEFARRLRANDPPVFVRITDDTVHMDPRTLLGDDQADLVAAVAQVAGSSSAS
ncbi:MAG: L-seryl-tRNA(Ser) seleniumtransferase [Planctomycetota bacterium]|jgi:L-seryl-tRNA(Ser) seleniumtransferase